MFRVRFLTVLLPLLGVVGTIAKPVQPLLSIPADAHLVVALYKADYTWRTWNDEFSDFPDNPYISSDAMTIARHIEEARVADIDAFIISWDGPTTELSSDANVVTVLHESMQRDFHAAVLMELGTPDLDSADEVTAALLALSETHICEAGYLHVGDSPVIFFRGQDMLSLPSWQAIRNRIDPEYIMLWIADDSDLAYLEVFDGIFGERSALHDDPSSRFVTISHELKAWEAIRDKPLLWVGAVMPGYAPVIDGSESSERPRSHGTYYASQWEAVRESGADWIIINSFNDWKMGTQIEPSPQYLDAYLTLTALQAGRFRTMVSEQIHVTETPEISPTTEFPQHPTVTATPEILLTASITETTPVTVTNQPSPTMDVKPQATLIHLFTPTPTLTPPGDIGLSSMTPSPVPLDDHHLLTPTPTLQHMPLESMPAQKKCFPFPLLLPIAVYVSLRPWNKRQK